MIIRWICEKDSKKWIYPIKKCIYCKGPITKQKSREAKIIGITKVNIPSPMHPITPYNVILLQDEYGNRMPKKTMKDYKIGDRYIINKAETEGAVVISKIKYDLQETLSESIRLLKSNHIDKDDKILIKPSIIESAYSYQAVNTNPKILEALISYLKGIGIKDIIVAEQAMIGNDLMSAAKKSGILEVCKNHEIDFIDLRKSEYIGKEFEGFKFNIAKEVAERKIINIPIMKTNSQIGISGAIENMLRVTDEDTQKRMFAGDIEKNLPKLLKVLPKFLTIADATIGMHGQGPTVLGEPAFLNMIFASTDPVAVDTIFVEMGLLPMPDYLKEASNLGLGNNNTKTIEVIGDELEAIKFHLTPPNKTATAHQNINLIDGKANPYIFNSALKMASKLFGLLGPEVNLVVGPNITKDMVAGKDRLVIYGNNAIKKAKELGITSIAEIQEDLDDIEKVMLLKSILEDPDKKGITATDKIKSKMVKFGAKLKGSFGR
jgi:uncharacterized protein (DUF362 family)